MLKRINSNTQSYYENHIHRDAILHNHATYHWEVYQVLGDGKSEGVYVVYVYAFVYSLFLFVSSIYLNASI